MAYLLAVLVLISIALIAAGWWLEARKRRWMHERLDKYLKESDGEDGRAEET